MLFQKLSQSNYSSNFSVCVNFLDWKKNVLILLKYKFFIKIPKKWQKLMGKYYKLKDQYFVTYFFARTTAGQCWSMESTNQTVTVSPTSLSWQVGCFLLRCLIFLSTNSQKYSMRFKSMLYSCHWRTFKWLSANQLFIIQPECWDYCHA